MGSVAWLGRRPHAGSTRSRLPAIAATTRRFSSLSARRVSTCRQHRFSTIAHSRTQPHTQPHTHERHAPAEGSAELVFAFEGEEIVLRWWQNGE
jgi:hypothetical protein